MIRTDNYLGARRCALEIIEHWCDQLLSTSLDGGQPQTPPLNCPKTQIEKEETILFDILPEILSPPLRFLKLL